MVSLLAANAKRETPGQVDCAHVKCVALTFDYWPGPYTDRPLRSCKDNNAKATFFLIGNKVAANPQGAKRIADAGMEIGSHTWEHPNMATIPPRGRRPGSSAGPATPSRRRPASDQNWSGPQAG